METRDCAAVQEHTLFGLDGTTLLACDAGQTQSLLQWELAETTDNETIADALSRRDGSADCAHR